MRGSGSPLRTRRRSASDDGRRFVGGIGGRARLRQRVTQHVHPKRLRRLRQEDLAARERAHDEPVGVASLHGIGRRQRGNGGAAFDGRVHRPPDQIRADERPGRIVNDHDIRAAGDERERVGDRILTARAAFDDLNGFGTAAQVLGGTFDKVTRERDHDVGNPIAQHERIDAPLKNGPSAEGEELFRPVAVKARAPASGGNDGAHVHGPAILPETVRLPPSR